MPTPQYISNKINFFSKWIIQKKKLILSYFENSKNRPIICHMGEVYFANLGVNIGFEIDKNRPVLIFQGIDFYTKNSDIVFIFPITSNTKKNPYKILFEQKNIEYGSIKNGGIIVSQGRSISKTRLLHKIGKIEGVILEKVQNKFERFLYKNTTLEIKNPKGDT